MINKNTGYQHCVLIIFFCESIFLSSINDTGVYYLTTIGDYGRQRYCFHGDLYRNIGPDIVTPKMVWYPWTIETGNKLLFLLITWLFHYIPAYIIDTVCLLLGKPQRFTRLYKKVYKSNIAFSYFLLGEWFFDDENTHKLYKGMSETDKTIFNFNVETLNIKELIIMWIVGLRKYVVKDNLQGREHAKRKWFWFKILHYITVVLYAFLWWKLFNWVFSFISFACNRLYLYSV